ncbi:MAG: hypothetical protein M3130_00965 [Actinomycetota bacterium]|nr:hypothetical protein [Actinomycetota bacterium]
MSYSIRLGTFTPSVLLAVCAQSGALADAGLTVVEEPVSSSPAQFSALLAGELDAAFTSPDNVIAYAFAQQNPLSRRVETTVVAALDRGLGLSLWNSPGAGETPPREQMRLGVDVPTSGFAFVAFELLRRAGRPPGSYEVESLGSTPKRAAALARSDIDVTVLNAGNELLAEAMGCRLVSRAVDLGPYLGTVLVRNRAADEPLVEALETLAEALLATSRAILAEACADQVVAAALELLGLNSTQAQRYHDGLRSEAEGLVPDGRVDLPALQTLLDLRRKFHPSDPLADVLPHLEDWVTSRARPR